MRLNRDEHSLGTDAEIKKNTMGLLVMFGAKVGHSLLDNEVQIEQGFLMNR